MQMMCLRVTSGKKIAIENGVGGALVATATRVDPTHAQQIVGNDGFMPYCARCGQNGWEICRRGSKKTARKSVAENNIDEGLKKEESARQLVQNDSATMKIQRFSWAVEVHRIQ